MPCLKHDPTAGRLCRMRASGSIFAPMIVGTGFDLVAVPRFATFLERRGERGLHRIFTDAEIEYCMAHASPTQFLAARFAAKEAFYKAIGTGMGPAGGWQDVEIVRLESGQPTLLLHGGARAAAQSMQAHRIHVSISHTAETAGAIVILETE